MLKQIVVGLWLTAAFFTFGLSGCASAGHQDHTRPNTASDTRPLGVLIFTKTAGYRHDSIPDGIAGLSRICERKGLHPIATEDAAVFSDEGMKNLRVIIFLSTTGDVLNDDQQGAMERFIRRGGGFVGIHAAADTEYGWPWYGELVGAWFKEHPAIGQEVVEVRDATHPATHDLPLRWPRTDEWYRFRAEPPANARLLLSLENTFRTEGTETVRRRLPVSWCREFDGGRTFYTSIGHTKDTYADPLAMSHFRGAILWAAHMQDDLPPVDRGSR